MGVTEPEIATSCNQIGLPEEGLGHELSHKTCDLQICPAWKLCWSKVGAETVGVANR